MTGINGKSYPFSGENIDKNGIIKHMQRVEEEEINEEREEKVPLSICDIQDMSNSQSYELLQERIETHMKKYPDSKITKSLMQVLDIEDHDRQKGHLHERDYKSSQFRVPLHKIKIDLTNFQNRHTAYSIDTVYGILDAIVRGEFIKELMNPIILRKNKEGDDYILAGHSRKEFAMWLDALYKNDISSLSQEAQKELNGWCRMSGYDIISLCQTAKNRCDANNYYGDKIGALYIDDIPFESAKTIALMSNALASAETDAERAAVYRNMRESMRTTQEIELFGRRCEKSNRGRIKAFSFLAPNGKAMDAVYAFDRGADDIYTIKKIAYRLGTLRKKNPQLSNLHENELFDRLLKDGVYGRNKRNGEIRNMEVFLDIVKRHIQYLQCHNEFASDKCLNIKKLKEVSYVMKDYQETLNAYRGQKQKFQREFNEMRRRISQLKIMKELPEEKKGVIAQLEKELGISFHTMANMDDVEAATELLFDDATIDPVTELTLLEERKNALFKIMRNIEEEYYIQQGKKPKIIEEEAKIIEIPFE